MLFRNTTKFAVKVLISPPQHGTTRRHGAYPDRPQMLTANCLKQGDVLYWKAGGWVMTFGRGRSLHRSGRGQCGAGRGARLSSPAIAWCAPYLFEVREQNGKIRPVKEREIIRAAGPSIQHRHLGKQAATMYRYDEFDAQFVAERVEQFRGQVARRLSGELTEDQFKPLRLMNGLYLQLHAYMLRIAVPYGTLASQPDAQAGPYRAPL